MPLWTEIWVNGDWILGYWAIVRQPAEGALADQDAFPGACSVLATCEGAISDEPVTAVGVMP